MGWLVGPFLTIYTRNLCSPFKYSPHRSHVLQPQTTASMDFVFRKTHSMILIQTVTDVIHVHDTAPVLSKSTTVAYMSCQWPPLLQLEKKRVFFSSALLTKSYLAKDLRSSPHRRKRRLTKVESSFPVYQDTGGLCQRRLYGGVDWDSAK